MGPDVFRAIYYSLQSIFKSFRKNALLHLTAIFTVWACFFVFGTGLNVFFNIRSLLNLSKMTTHVSVYLDQEIDDTNFQDFKKRNCDKNFVSICSYVSSAQAKGKFLKKNPDLQETLNILDENPFPPSIEIDFQKDFKSIEVLKSFSTDLQKEKHVTYVDDGGKWVTNWLQILSLFDRLTYVLGIVFGCLVIFFISSTIQLLVYARRDEVEILSLVGATRGMIRLPFLTEGALHGLIGSVLSIITVKLSFVWIANYLHQVWPGFIPDQIVFIPWFAQFFVILFATAVGFLGGFLAVGKFFK